MKGIQQRIHKEIGYHMPGNNAYDADALGHVDGRYAGAGVLHDGFAFHKDSGYVYCSKGGWGSQGESLREGVEAFIAWDWEVNAVALGSRRYTCLCSE